MNKVIRRYENRKMYDAETAKYVKNSDVLDMVASGQNVQVLNYVGGQNVTREILFSALFGKSRQNGVADQEFINLLQKVADYFKGVQNV